VRVRACTHVCVCVCLPCLPQILSTKGLFVWLFWFAADSRRHQHVLIERVIKARERAQQLQGHALQSGEWGQKQDSNSEADANMEIFYIACRGCFLTCTLRINNRYSFTKDGMVVVFWVVK